MDKNIKDYRQKELCVYVIVNILMIIYESGMLDIIISILQESIILKVAQIILGSTALYTILYLCIIIADSIIPGKWKMKFIWLFSEMPGEVIFTKIREQNNDKRFTANGVLQKYNNVYDVIDTETDKQKIREFQNANWYKIYQDNENKPQVFNAHREFLLFRDMSVLTIFIIIGTSIFYLYNTYTMHCWVFIILIIELCITWLIARSKGRRFVYNVIAVDLAKAETLSLSSNS